MTPEHVDVRAESRLLCAVLAFELMKGMATGGLWILSPQSITGRIAALSTYPTVLATVWIALSLFVLPFFLTTLCDSETRYSHIISWLGRRAILCSGVIWCFLAFLSKNLDYEFVTAIFISNGVTCLAVSFVLARSINSAQRRREAKP